jgi:hypothetical protein
VPIRTLTRSMVPPGADGESLRGVLPWRDYSASGLVLPVSTAIPGPIVVDIVIFFR